MCVLPKPEEGLHVPQLPFGCDYAHYMSSQKVHRLANKEECILWQFVAIHWDIRSRLIYKYSSSRKSKDYLFIAKQLKCK